MYSNIFVIVRFLSVYFRGRTKVVHSPDFKIGCGNVLGEDGGRLTKAKPAALSPFTIDDDGSAAADEVTSFVASLEWKRKRADNKQQYALQ